MQNEMTLFKTKHWEVILIPNQAYLGRCVVVLNRPAQTLSDLRPGELKDFHDNVVVHMEKSYLINIFLNFILVP